VKTRSWLPPALWLLGCCACTAPPPAEAPAQEGEASAPAVAAPDPDKLGPTGPDGVLRAEAATVFSAPLPVQSQSVAVGSGWAGYQSSHSYREVTSFYRKKLGEGYQAVQRSGGTRFSSEDGLTDIYVPIPREPGAPVRVFYFNRGADAPIPPVVGAPLRASGGGGASGGGASGGGASGGGASGGGASGAAAVGGGEAPSHYDQQVTTDAQGRKVIIYQPKAGGGPRGAGASGAGAGEAGAVGGWKAPPEGPYRAVRIPFPSDVLD
jgi:hypothetical protein